MKRLLLAIMGVILTWSLVTPVFEFPDEQAHFGTVSYLLQEGHLPGYHVPDMTIEMTRTQKLLGTFRNPQGQNSYTYHPEYHPVYTDSLTGKFEGEIRSLNTSENRTTYTTIEEAARYPALYYAFTSLFTRIVNGHDLITRIFVSRLGSLVITLGMTLTIWRTGYLLFQNKKRALTLTVITMLQPMMSFTTAGVNSDNLHNLFSFITIYLGLRVVKHGVTPKSIILLIIVILADLYTKPQGFILIPLALSAILIRALREKQYRLILWTIILGIAILALGSGQLNQYKGFLNITNSNGASLIEYLRFSLNKLMAQNVVWYWGVFKWLGVVLPPIYWRVANRVVALSVVGLLVYLWKVVKNRVVITNPYLVSYLLVTSLIYALVIFWFDWQYLKGWGFSLGIQARYFFPTLISHISLLMIGVLSLASTARWQNILRSLLIILFLWLQLGAVWHLLSIYYDTSSVSALITQLSQYKPIFAKGNWWYLWFTIYITSITSLACSALCSKCKNIQQSS